MFVFINCICQEIAWYCSKQQQYNNNKLIACPLLNQGGACLKISMLEGMEHASTFSHKVNACSNNLFLMNKLWFHNILWQNNSVIWIQ